MPNSTPYPLSTKERNYTYQSLQLPLTHFPPRRGAMPYPPPHPPNPHAFHVLPCHTYSTDPLTHSPNTSLTHSPHTSLTHSPHTSLTHSPHTSLTHSPHTSLTHSPHTPSPTLHTLPHPLSTHSLTHSPHREETMRSRPWVA